MPKTAPSHVDLALTLARAWDRLERSLDASISGTRGVSFAEYRILRALQDSPEGQAARVDLAAAVGLTPSGVTRALQPLEKIGVVRTVRSERDARLALAQLTKAGREVVSDASGVIEDVVASVLRGKRSASVGDLVHELIQIL